ncbi:murein biosynthesis integral membrane protein MurJ [Anaerococcus sp. NML200574]|uniref:murein biosynthesis integral membrane protein MurJ n=1 Tax=Anaerococcus sp. NML200574 TaxID=2954486 RepID=UPI00223743DC|nr:murein biosynthesis integral membrane protein MurJ [Anaerococcus sp. NML200574]MCW6677548.1 murein biosynthesis integral membrane protein MurJ [Anaerococcus sp. NML200574]
MGQTTLMLMIITIVSKVFGFVREAVMASFIGASDLKSIYTTANTLPVVAANFVAVGIISGFIPIYNKAKNEEGEAAAEEFTSNIFNILMRFGLVAVVLGIIFARPFSKILSPSLEGEWLDLATNYTRIMMFAVFAYLYSAVFRGYLNLKGNFFDPAITGILMNVIIIIFTILTGITGNPYLLIIGALLGNVLQYILFPKAAKDAGYEHKRTFDIHNKYVRSLMLISIPIIISSAAGELSIIADNSMASAFFGKAAISKLFYSKTMLTLITGVITVSVTTAIFPKIASLGQSGEFEQMKGEISSAVVTTMSLVIPATIGMMVLSRPIIELVFERNAFTSDDTAIVASLLTAYSPYIIFQSLSDVVDRGFYAVGDSKTPVIIVVMQQFLNIILNFILIKFFDLEGLAYATVLSTAIGSAFMLYKFRDNFGAFNFRQAAISLGKIILATCIMAFLAMLTYSGLAGKISHIIALFVAIIVAGFVYVLLILLARIPEVMELVNHIYHKLFGRREKEKRVAKKKRKQRY